MKNTGIELIAKEREEQISKHGYTEDFTNDHPEYYSGNQLSNVARALLFSEYELSAMQLMIDLKGAEGWDIDYLKYAESKPYQERLIIAGALIAAEIDRINTNES